MIPSPANDLNPVEQFVGYYMAHDLLSSVPSFHREMYQLAYEGHKRMAFAAPRGFAKSFIFSKFYPLYQTLFGNRERIFIVSRTGALATRWMREIKTELESNPFIQHDFGDLTTAKWTEDHIIVNNRVTGRKIELIAKGAGYQIRGFRPDFIVLDDIDDDEAVLSEDQRSKQEDWYYKELLNTLTPDGQLVVVGTVIHPLALLRKILDSPQFLTRIYKAYLPDGSSLWPELWPVSRLKEKEEEIGAMAFRSEFMNEPMVSDNPIFVKEAFRGYSHTSAAFESELSKGLYTVVSIDPAISKKQSSDYTAIVTVSATFDKEPKCYVRPGGTVRGHWPINKQVDELMRIALEYKATQVVIETVAYQEALAQEVRRWQEYNRIHIPVIEIKPDRDKERRAHNVVGLFQRGQVHFDFDDAATRMLTDELQLFPTGDRDDYVDALVYTLTQVREWSARVGRASGPIQVLPNGVKPSEFTGIA